jgi:RHS repeat-associated protein
VAYGLDSVGNRLSLGSSVSGIASSSVAFNPDDWMASETYDANGNTTLSGGRTFAYDSENRLTSMNNGAVSIVYDGFGNRVAETASGVTTKYLVEDDVNPTGLPQVFDETVNGVVTRTYTYGLQRIDENQQINGTWAPSFYGYDSGGTVRQLTNPSGAVTDTYNYDAFGNKLSSTGITPNNYLCRGEEFDTDLGLYYLRARYYNPKTGRFLSRDSVDGSSVLPVTFHKYLYVGDNPIRFVDPLGKALSDYAGAGAIALSAVVDLGQKVNIEGTIDVTQGNAVILIDNISGIVTQGLPGVLGLLQSAATALGAASMMS